MRDPARIDKMLERLRAAWLTNPDARLGQLIYNAAWAFKPGKDIFFVEDEDTLNGLEWIIERDGNV